LTAGRDDTEIVGWLDGWADVVSLDCRRVHPPSPRHLTPRPRAGSGRAGSSDPSASARSRR
jgi:hypothetical protein